MWAFLLISTLSWGIAEIFYKKGNLEKEKYSHLKTTMFVGFLMGIYALVILLTQNIDIKSLPLNFVYYLPVALCYIISMICSYFGVRFLEESISDPIENTSGALVPVLCALFLHEYFNLGVVIGIVVTTIGLIGISLFDKKGKENREKKYGKKLAIWALAMPFCYLVFDAIGTFLDIFYTNSVDTTLLINVTEENIEHTANTAYELTFFIVAIIIFIFLKVKKVRIFETNTNEENLTFLKKIDNQKYKILASIFEVIGQATYLFALSSGEGIAAVIIGSGTVIVSIILSRIFLREKLTFFQYIFIGIILSGIIVVSLFGA